MSETVTKPVWTKANGRFVKTDRTVELPREWFGPPAGAPQAEVVPPAPRRVRRKTIRQRAKAFLAAIKGPAVSDEVYAERLRICQSNECGYLKRVGEDLYCGACGCPRWRLAELRSKLRHQNLECPCDPPLWKGTL